MLSKRRCKIFLALSLLGGLPALDSLFAQRTVLFTARQDYAVGGNPNFITVMDLNRDTLPDLAITNTSGTVSILLGQGQGTFRAAPAITVGKFPRWVSAGDLDGDGRPDLAVINLGESPDPGTLAILLGNGDGTFRPLPVHKLGRAPSSAAVGDFNGDGRLDLAVATSGPGTDPGTLSILLGNGDGTFRTGFTMRITSGVTSISTADLNGDNKPDLIALNGASAALAIFLGNGDGTFRAAPAVAMEVYLTSVAAADLNGDGKVDLVVTNSFRNSVNVLLGNGDGTFRPASTVAYATSPTSASIGDLNGDGIPDLAVANYTNSPGRISILLGLGDGSFREAPRVEVGEAPQFVTIADLNDDGSPDLVVANSFSFASTISISLGRGDGTFISAPVLSAGVNINALVTGDFNGDGLPDLAGLGTTSDRVIIWLGEEDGTLSLALPVPVGFRPSALTVGDFNGDAVLDLAVASIGSTSIHFGRGDGTFRAGPIIPAGGDARAIVAADFNGDGVVDLAITNYYARSVSILLGNGDGTFRVMPAIPVAGEATAMVVGDFNRDGLPDLAVTGHTTGNISILLSYGDGSFIVAPTIATDGGWILSIAAADFNGDGILDLAPSGSTIYLGNGDGTFRALPIGLIGPAPITAADLNGDNIPDLITANDSTFSDTVSVFLGRGDGTFDAPFIFGVGPAPNSIVVGDFNHDGRSDLAVSYFGGTAILTNGSP